MTLWRVLLLASLAVAGFARESDRDPVTERDGQPLITHHKSEDPEMAAAMEKARSTLSTFESRLKNPPATQTRISLKGRFEDDGHVEHMWIEDVEVTRRGYRGRLSNLPLDITSITLGDTVTVPKDRVSDWFAIDDGKLVGGYTLRLQRARLPPDKRAAFDQSVQFVIAD